MKINPTIFRSYDIRGVYPSEINKETAYKIGRAFVKFLSQKQKTKSQKLNLVVGRDNRLSSPELFKFLTKGILEEGANVIDIGLATSPMFYFGVARFNFDGGIQITASVDGSEFALIKEIDSQKQFLIKVGDFIDSLIEKKEKPQKFSILSFNPQNGRVQFKSIKNVFRHLLNEKLYQLTLKYGKKIKVTEFHSVYILRDNKAVSIPTKDLKVNDLVAVPNFIPNTSYISPINLVKELHPFRDKLREIIISGPDVKKILLKRYFNSSAKKKRISLPEEGRQILHQRRKEMKLSRRECAEIYNLSPMTIQRIELEGKRKFVKEEYLKKYIRALGLNPVKKFLSRFNLEQKNFPGHWKGGLTFQTLKISEISSEATQEIEDCQLHGSGFPQYSIENKIDITPELVRLIGYYLAEGNLKNRLRVCFNLGLPSKGHEKFIIDDIIDSSKKAFNYLPKVYKDSNQTKVVIDNSIIYGLFAKVLGFENKNSLTKELPNLLFTLPLHFKIELLKAFFLGDGAVGTNGKNISFHSASKKLIGGISYLLTQMGITYSLTEENPSRKNRSVMYGVTICNKIDLKKLKMVWEKHWKVKNIEAFCQREKNCQRKVQKFNNLIFLPIREIKRIFPISKFVYDFSVEGETFIVGMGGICCHNSHNPPQYNGFKFVREKAIPISSESGLKEIKKIVEKYSSERISKKLGKIKKKNFLKDYLNFNFKLAKINKIKPLKIILDTANAVSGIDLRELFKRLPCKVYHLFPELDGNFPNHPPDPLIKKNLRFLKKEVKNKKADLGIALDGDGDRIIFVDEKGKIVRGDFVTALISQELLKENPGEKILYEIRSSQIVKETIIKNRGVPILGRAGHSLIKEQMRKENIFFAGELSGHYFFREIGFFEAPLLVILKILNIVNQGNKPISKIIQPFKIYFQSSEINFKIKDKGRKIKEIEKHYSKKAKKIIRLDGITVESLDWWFNLRPSGTENLLRLNIEAKTKKLLKEKKKELVALIKS